MTHWLELPAGTAFVEFSELSHRLALTLHPTAPDDRRYDLRYGVAEMNFQQELHKAVDTGLLRVLDPLTHGPHSYPFGAALQSAVVKLSELRAFIVDRGIGVRVLPAEPAPAVMPAPEPAAKAEPAPTLDTLSKPAVKHEPPPLTTPEIAEAFDGIGGQTAAQLRSKLGDVKNHHWLLPARAAQARAPKPATWWPLKIADSLLQRQASAESLNRAFLTVPMLKPWLHLWQEKRRERNAFGQ